MAETTWTRAQFRAHEVIVAHQQDDAGTCTCGWHDRDGSWTSHLVNELTVAGVFGPRQFASLDEMRADAERQADPD